MAKPRSPILGYNHNVRYRGLVFHVQTEDSGIVNPHVFTHLFHGGVILTTRKLVYDSDSAEESVKALMQSQHKAVLRDLKKQLFDDKIDAYLGGTPGLLPRGAVDTGADPDTPSMVMSVPTPGAVPPPLEEPLPPTAEPALSLAALAASLDAAPAPQVPFPELPTMPIPSRTTTAQQGTPPPGSVSIPRPGSRSGRMPALTAELEGRAPTIEAEALPPPPDARGTQPPPFQDDREDLQPRATTEVMIPEDPATSGRVRRDVSAAFEAIMVAEGEQMPTGGALVEVAENDVGQVYSAAPDSAPLPPGVTPVPPRPTEYAQHRRRESGRFTTDGEPMPPPPNAPGVPQPILPQPSSPTRASQPRVPAPPVMARPATTPPPRPSQQRVATPVASPPPPPSPGQLPRATTQVYSTPAARTTTPPVQPPPRPGQPRTRSPGTGGVVVTRPAVIIGAPPRQVGNTGPNPAHTAPTPPPTPPPTPTQPPPAAPITGQHAAQKGRARKAREDTDGGVFGQDLISEKSLDEVILAYLSEDGTEE